MTCPHCGDKGSWNYRNSYLAKGNKELIEVSYCPHCDWRFIEHYKLHPVTHNGKLKTEIHHEKTRWQKFCTDGLKQGKSLQELSRLYWREWQNYHKWPSSLADLTDFNETGETKP